MIELININKKFDEKHVVKDLNLKVNQGEFVSLLGPSGCGKSTTLKLITGILDPEQGDIRLDGKSILPISIDKRETLLVFQDYVLFPHMTVEKNIDFGLRMRKMKKLDRRNKVKEMLDLVNMKGYEKKYPSELSGGQRQRVALARALAVNPKVLLLDEPFSSLDRQLRIETRDFIRDLQMKMGITTILVTHDQEEAWMVSDRVAIMLEGQVVQYDSPEKIYKAPSTEAVGAFLGNMNFFDGEVVNKKVSFSLGCVPHQLEDGKVRMMIRKENIHVTEAKEQKIEGKKALGKILKRSFGGQNIYYQVECQGQVLEGIGIGERALQVGSRANIHIEEDQIHYFRNE